MCLSLDLHFPNRIYLTLLLLFLECKIMIHYTRDTSCLTECFDIRVVPSVNLCEKGNDPLVDIETEFTRVQFTLGYYTTFVLQINLTERPWSINFR